MKVLLVAYEFAPSPSPQSLRWIYLVRSLARQGHDIHVLAPDLADYHSAGLPALPDGVKVHRCFAGPINGYLAWSQRQVRRRLDAKAAVSNVSPRARTEISAAMQVSGTAPLGAPQTPEPLNWKGVLWHIGLKWKVRLFDCARASLEWLVYPDLRGEWEPWARRRLRTLLRDVAPDVVITSHEPATTLKLGLLSKRLGFPWVADLGDPVLAPYTPARWRRKALRLESKVCRLADGLVVTAEGARKLLEDRHGSNARFKVITQGFDEDIYRQSAESGVATRTALELLYTGSIYGFRTCEALVDAVIATPGARLSMASMNAPDSAKRAAIDHPDSIRLLGFVPHLDVLGLQRDADVLVNIGNELPDQVPGKLYEYLGACKPILHIASGTESARVAVLDESRRVIACLNAVDSIAEVLRRLVASQDIAGEWGLDLGMERVRGYGWGVAGEHMASVLDEAAAHARESGSA